MVCATNPFSCIFFLAALQTNTEVIIKPSKKLNAVEMWCGFSSKITQFEKCLRWVEVDVEGGVRCTSLSFVVLLLWLFFVVLQENILIILFLSR